MKTFILNNSKRLYNMPSKIVEIGFGRYLSRFLTLLGLNTFIKIKIIKYLKIIIYFKVWIKSKNIKNYINDNNKLSIPKDSKSLKFPKNTYFRKSTSVAIFIPLF